jgi:hypothetical protein
VRRAFDAVMNDAAFRGEASKMGVEVDPMTGEQTQSIILDVIQNTRPAAAERVRKIFETAI